MKPAPVATSEADIKKEGTDGGIALREVNGTAGIWYVSVEYSTRIYVYSFHRSFHLR